MCRSQVKDSASGHRITHVDLLQGGISGPTLVALLEGLPSLTSLALYSCSSGAFSALSKHLALNPVAALTSLSIQSPLPAPHGGGAVADLASALTLHASLVHLRLSHCSLGLAGISEVVLMLEHNRVLRHVDLSGNSCPATGQNRQRAACVVTWDSLTLNPCLQSLDLSKCQLGDTEASSLAAALEQNLSVLPKRVHLRIH